MFLWALSFPLSEILMDSYGAVALSALRLILSSSILLLLWWKIEGFVVLCHAPWKRGTVIGGIGFGIGSILLLIGQEISDPVTPAIAVAMMPVAGAALEVWLDGRKLNSILVMGIVVAILGGWVAAGVSDDDPASATQASIVGMILCLAAVVLFAWATRATTKGLSELSHLGRCTITLIGAMLVNGVIFAFGLMLHSPYTAIGATDIVSLSMLLFSGLAGMALSQLLWIRGAATLGILVASVHMNAVPFYVMIIVVLALSAPWQWLQALGGVLVLIGVLLTQLSARIRSD